jgi:hypothetical protein
MKRTLVRRYHCRKWLKAKKHQLRVVPPIAGGYHECIAYSAVVL